MEDDLKNTNEETPSKLNNLLDKHETRGVSPQILKSLLFLFIGTCFSLFSQGKTYFANKMSSSYVTEVNIPYAINFFALLVTCIVCLAIIKFQLKKINLMTIIISVLFAGLSIIEVQGYGTNASEFSHVIATWILIIYIIVHFVTERRNLFNQSIYLYIGLAIAIAANSFELMFTFLDVRKEIDPLRTILTEKNAKDNLLSILNALFYVAIFFLIERYLKTTASVLYFLPYFSGINAIVSLIASLCAREFKNLKDIFDGNETSSIVLTCLGIGLANGVIFGAYPLLVVRCSAFVLIICLNFRVFWRYIFMIIDDDEQYENMKKNLGGHIFSMILFFIAMFIICYDKLKDEKTDTKKLEDEVKNIPDKEGGNKLISVEQDDNKSA